MDLTTLGSACISFHVGALRFGLEESFPVASVGVAEIGVLEDDHVTVADFFEGAKAQIADVKLSNGNAAATPTQDKKKAFLSLNVPSVIEQFGIYRGTLRGTYRFVRPRMTSRFSKGLSELMFFGHVWIHRYPGAAHSLFMVLFLLSRMTHSVSDLTSDFFNSFKHIKLGGI